ncbi:MAG: ATP-binding protein, partial [Nocardioidaceae bacterium]|nr:ATP-binding protein [Nocardioidaceae bacterium]
MASHETVAVSKNRLFGRHLAILGNTGSGKSCSLTHLLREAARDSARSSGSFRAVILDLNGEYSHAFDDLSPNVPVRRFAMEPTKEGIDAGVAQLRVPYWLWNYREWHAFADPSDKSQAPVLRRALHVLRTSGGGGWPEGVVTLVMGRRIVRDFRGDRIGQMSVTANLSLLENVMNSCKALATTLGDQTRTSLLTLQDQLSAVLDKRRDRRVGHKWTFGAPGPDFEECGGLLNAFDAVIDLLKVPDMGGDVSSIDRPDPFDALNLAELMNVIAVGTGPDVASWVAPMQDRLEVAMSDHRLRATCGYVADES